MPELTISQLARRANVNIATIRYYERRGLIKKPKRSTSGYRLYSSDFLDRINFIVKTKSLGFTLKEISSLLALENQSTHTCENTQIKVANKIKAIKERIYLLQSISSSLQRLYDQCNSLKHKDNCSITNCFNTENCKSD